MAGYTPLFDTLTKGTLCGKWPDIGLWPIVLSMADRHGVVDVTHQYIATITGLDIEQVTACMARFCEPDPLSRSQSQDGARLALLDEHRNWGWRVVNHGKYTEKARLIHKNARDIESGKEAERKRLERAEKEASADVRRCPPMSASQSQSKAKDQSQKDSPDGESARKRATRLPDDFPLTAERRLVAEAESLPAERTFASFCDYWRAEAGPKARKLDWDATWRNWCRREQKKRPDSEPQRPVRRLSDACG